VEREVFEIRTVDCQRFARFILSVLWRASISKRRPFANVNLGPYENVARDIIFSPKSLSELRAFEVFVARFKSDHLDPSGLNYYPFRTKFDGINLYQLGLAGFRIVAKFDNRAFPPAFAPFIINRSNVFRGPFLTLEQSSEFQWLTDIVKRHG
jgi:hypothetical protein